MHKTLFRVSLAAVWLIAASEPATSQETFTISSVVPPTHHISSRMIMPWAKQIESGTEGRVKFRLLPKAVTGPRQQLDAVRDGLADVSFVAHGWTAGRFVLTQAAEFPFLGDNAMATALAYQRIHDRHFAKVGEHKRQGVMGLSVWTHGPAHIYTARKAINRLEDFQGLKIRVSPSTWANKLARALQISAVIQPAPQSYELLSSGVVDGIFFPHDGICLYRLETLLKHNTLVPGGLYNISFALIMNPDKFGRLSSHDQKIVLAASGETFARRSGQSWDVADAKCVGKMTAAGVRMQTASADLLARIKQATRQAEQDWIDQVKSMGVDGAAVMRELRAEVKKIEAESKK